MTPLTRGATVAPRGLLVIIALAWLASACSDDTSTTAGDGGSETTETTTDAPIGGPYPVADLTVNVVHPDTDLDVTYNVACLGDTATISGDEVDVDEQEACLALAEVAVQKRLVEGPPADQACTEQYGGPDVATVAGTIDDVDVDAVIDRVNGCGIADWDTLLSRLLPPAVGAV